MSDSGQFLGLIDDTVEHGHVVPVFGGGKAGSAIARGSPGDFLAGNDLVLRLGALHWRVGLLFDFLWRVERDLVRPAGTVLRGVVPGGGIGRAHARGVAPLDGLRGEDLNRFYHGSLYGGVLSNVWITKGFLIYIIINRIH